MDVRVWPDVIVILVGFNAEGSSLGADRVTVPANPFLLATAIVEVSDPPGVIVI